MVPANHLQRYVDFVAAHARSEGGVDEGLLFQALGSGLLTVLSPKADGRRLVTKTPSVHNLEYVFKLFPDAYLLILVRDGRAVVESGVTSDFGWTYEQAMRDWAKAANKILRFDHKRENSDLNYLIVRYEDLITNLESELRRILAFLDLDISAYDLEGAKNVPVRGSSAYHGSGESEIHWEPVDRTTEFKPLSRWHHWGRALHERFNWLAGDYLVQFGYEQKAYTANRSIWNGWNRLLDLSWYVKDKLREIRKRILQVIRRVVA